MSNTSTPANVRFRETPIMAVGTKVLGEIKNAAFASPMKRARLCLHSAPDEAVQDMIIALVQGYPVTALRHVGIRKTYYMIEGALRVVFYSDDGKIEEEYALEAGGELQILTFQADRWHSCAALSPVVVFAESLPGPFHPERAERRDWAL